MNEFNILGAIFFYTLMPALVSWLVLLLAIKFLPDHFMAAKFEARSNHRLQARQIGGLMIVPIIMAWMIFTEFSGHYSFANHLYLLAFVMLYFCGVLDDLAPLGMKLKLLIQFLAVALLLNRFPVPILNENVQGLNYVTTLLVVFCFVYWINITNFMDGIDLMMVSGLGIPLLFLGIFDVWINPIGNAGTLGLVMFGGLLGFAFFNRPPAKIFLGDGGSLFFGAASGLLIYQMICTGSLASGIVPFSYFIVDATSTLSFRIFNRQNIFKAHSEHAYQIAYRNGFNVWRICGTVLAVNLALCILAFFAWDKNWNFQMATVGIGLILAGIVVWYFRFQAQSPANHNLN